MDAMTVAAPLRLSASYSTPQVAELAGLTFRQLDHYTNKGLLLPSRPATGQGSRRIWSDDDLARARLVAALRKLGASTEVMARVLQQLAWDPTEWPGYLFISPDGEIHNVRPAGPAWWGVATRRLLEPARASAA